MDREPEVRKLYEDVGAYLGYGLAQYCEFHLADAIAKEKEAIAAFDSMSASKRKEIQALTDEIEAKTVRHGEAEVEL